MSAMPAHSVARRRSCRNTTEKSARSARPKPRTGWTIDTGAFAIAFRKNPQPVVVTKNPANQSGERMNARYTAPCRSARPRRGRRSAAIFCMTMPTW